MSFITKPGSISSLCFKIFFVLCMFYTPTLFAEENNDFIDVSSDHEFLNNKSIVEHSKRPKKVEQAQKEIISFFMKNNAFLEAKMEISKYQKMFPKESSSDYIKEHLQAIDVNESVSNGNFLVKVKRYSDAEKVFERVLEIDVNNEEAKEKLKYCDKKLQELGRDVVIDISIEETSAGVVQKDRFKRKIRDYGAEVVLSKKGNKIYKLHGKEKKDRYFEETPRKYVSEKKIAVKEKRGGSNNVLQNGIVKEHYLDGSIRSEGNYVDGKKEGVFKVFDQKGKLLEEKEYKYDKRNGTSRNFYKNGVVKKESIHEMGELRSSKFFDQKGKFISEKEFK